jgi:peptidylamidoglycolate lyase
MKHLLLTTIAAVVLVGCGASVESSPQVEAKVKPTSLYSLDTSWPKLPKGVELGQVTGVAVDSHNHVFVFHRSDRTWIQPFPKEKIKGHTIAMFNGETGELIKTFGEDKFIIPHGLSVDPQDNVWVTDVGSQQIHKLSHEDGAALLSIGEPGVQGDDQNHFALPSDVSFSKDGGIYVSDGYVNTRVVKYSPSGKYEFEWGTPGARPGFFNLPHGIEVDENRVYVADRSNLRLQIFDHKGSYLSEWKGERIGRPFVIEDL